MQCQKYAVDGRILALGTARYSVRLWEVFVRNVFEGIMQPSVVSGVNQESNCEGFLVFLVFFGKSSHKSKILN